MAPSAVPPLTIQRLEAAEVSLARMLDGGAGADCMGGYAAFVSPDSPFTHVVGAGVNGPVASGELDAVERFYAERQASAVFELSPLADAGLLELLQARGYRVTQFENTLVLNLVLPPGPLPTAAPEHVCQMEAGDESAWTDLAARAFFSTLAAEDGERAIVEPFARRTRAYWALTEGGRAAAAALWLDEEVAFFLADATLPGHRGRGLHQKLIQRRLLDAVAAGARWATASTGVNSISQSNYLRFGFRVLYTKFAMAKTGG